LHWGSWGCRCRQTVRLPDLTAWSLRPEWFRSPRCEFLMMNWGAPRWISCCAGWSSRPPRGATFLWMGKWSGESRWGRRPKVSARGGVADWEVRFISALAAGGGDALDEIALGEKEEDDDGENDQGRGCHQVVPGGAALLALKGLQSEGERELVLIGEID
jgi:hypothetical protein